MASPSPTCRWVEIINDVVTGIQGLGLTWTDATGTHTLPANRVYPRRISSFRQVDLPCVIVCMGGPEEYDPGDYEHTTIVYTVLVVTVFGANQELSLNNDALYWRQAITDQFLDLRLLVGGMQLELTTCEVFDCQMNQKTPLDLLYFNKENFDAGGLLFRFFANYQRPAHN